VKGVVVIDDQPEVTFDDPNFLFESNEGFQEVYSKKTQRTKRAQDSSPPVTRAASENPVVSKEQSSSKKVSIKDIKVCAVA
jgi:hypothetical protein